MGRIKNTKFLESNNLNSNKLRAPAMLYFFHFNKLCAQSMKKQKKLLYCAFNFPEVWIIMRRKHRPYPTASTTTTKATSISASTTITLSVSLTSALNKLRNWWILEEQKGNKFHFASESHRRGRNKDKHRKYFLKKKVFKQKKLTAEEPP